MVEVPKSRMVNTGDQGLVQQVIDDFFSAVRDEIGGMDHEYSFDSFGHCRLSRTPPLEADGQTTILFYNGRAVAGVVETRTTHNRVAYDFYQSTWDWKKDETV